MDVADWGEKQHQLHTLIAPTRAAEYGIPIFRLASSGISQIVSGQGQVIRSLPFPGQDASFFGRLPMSAKPHLPLDRHLGLACSLLAILGTVGAVVANLKERRKRSLAPCRLS
jgi:apolipoprotein N-acyltransferase